MASVSPLTISSIFKVFLICIVLSRSVSPFSENHLANSHEDYCGALAPRVTSIGDYGTYPFFYSQNGYYFPKSNSPAFIFVFLKHFSNRISSDKVFAVEAGVSIFENITEYYYRISVHEQFAMRGYWSQATGELCMISTNHAPNVLGIKLSGISDSYNISTLISGRLENLSKANAPPTHLLIFPPGKFQISNAVNSTVPAALSFPNSVALDFENCFKQGAFNLFYQKRCIDHKSCHPLDGSRLFRFLYMIDIRGEDAGRFKLEFFDYGTEMIESEFTPLQHMVAEGIWNPKERRVSMAACRIEAPLMDFDSYRAADCSTRITISVPKVVTYANASTVLGFIYSTKSPSESGYFHPISVRSFPFLFEKQRYNFTVINEALHV